MSTTETTSIIIPVSRDNETLRRCFAAIIALKDRPDEVLLIGDEAPDSLPDEVNFVFIKTMERSPCVKRNIGVKKAKGSIVCFIDDDVQVSPDWLGHIKSILKENPQEIIGGPNHDFRKDFSFRFPSAIQANVITEGLSSHKKMVKEKHYVGIHDLPLCNVALRKEVFEKIGGFNEDVPYFLDDVEFNYIADKMGYPLVQYDKLEVQHNIRPAWSSYFKYKFRTRWEIGKVMPLYSCLYSKSLQIRLVFASYVFLPLLILANLKIFLYGAIAYLLLLCASAFPFRKDPPVFVLLPLGVFITQCLMYAGFTAGLIWGYVKIKEWNRLIPQKEARFQKFQETSV